MPWEFWVDFVKLRDLEVGLFLSVNVLCFPVVWLAVLLLSWAGVGFLVGG